MLAFLVGCVGMLLGAAGSAVAQSPTGLQISTQPSSFPADFDESVTDYVVRCEQSNQVQVSVSTPENTNVSVDGHPERGGSFTESVSPLSAGQRFELEVTSDASSTSYHFRCLPSDFPGFSVERSGPTQAEWYGVTPGLGGSPPPGVSRLYATFFDSNGVPVWWTRDADRPYDVKLLPNGNLAWTHSTWAEEHRLDGSMVRRLDPVGGFGDLHDVQLLPNGNYLIGRYVPEPDVDMSSCGGSTSRELIDAEIQELTPEGALVWSWLASDHIPVSEVTASWEEEFCATGDGDIYHWNSIEPDGDGYMLSFRHLDAVYRIDRATGEIDWKLGGESRAESLIVLGDSMSAGSTFGGQHDARVLADGSLTVHDNGSRRGRPPRAVRFAIDEEAGTATLLEAITDPNAPTSTCCGSTRRLPDGNWVSEWGANPYVTEQTSTGEPVFRLSFDNGLFSYRANPVLPGQLSRSALRAGMDEQFPRTTPTPPPTPPPGEPPPPPDDTPPDENPPPLDQGPPSVDTDPPETTLTKAAADETEKTIRFRFTSDEPGSSFRCKLDKQPWKACSSPREFRRLNGGKHRFRVRAKDAAGNVDPTAAENRFRIVG